MKKSSLAALLLLLLSGLAGARADESMAGLADPMQPYAGAATWGQTRGGMVLQSTLVSQRRRLAVINGRMFTVGERVGNAMIVSITPYEVILRRAGRETSLRLLPDVGIHRTTNEDVPDAPTP